MNSLFVRYWGEFYCWKYQPNLPPQMQMDTDPDHEVLALAQPTLCHPDCREGHSELVSSFPSCSPVHGHQHESPKTPKKLAEALECTLATLEITKPETPKTSGLLAASLILSML